MNGGYVTIALYFLNRTDKISVNSKLVINLLLVAITMAGIVASGLAIREGKRPKPSLRRLERLAIMKFALSFSLSIAAGFLPAYVSKYPKEIETFITVTFPSISRQAALITSKAITFLTTGVMGLVTTVAINILSNHIYDKIRRKPKGE